MMPKGNTGPGGAGRKRGRHYRIIDVEDLGPQHIGCAIEVVGERPMSAKPERFAGVLASYTRSEDGRSTRVRIQEMSILLISNEIKVALAPINAGQFPPNFPIPAWGSMGVGL